MDYLEGKSLGEILAQEGRISAQRAIPIFLQTAEALAHAHEHGVIHRDLKPSNIMLLTINDQHDFVKIVDFGIAKLLDPGDSEDHSQQLTLTGDVFGSPLYMSPEQCLGKKLDRRADVYSLGCSMYEAVSGRPPIMGSNTLETMNKQLTEIPESIVEKNSNDVLMKRLNAITMKCLAKEKEQRYADMFDLRKDLILACVDSESTWSTLSKAAKSAPKKPYQPNFPKPLVLSIASLALVSLSILIVVVSSANQAHYTDKFDQENLWTLDKKAAKRMAQLADQKKLNLIIDQFERADLMRRQNNYTEAQTLYSSLEERLRYSADSHIQELMPAIMARADFGLALSQVRLKEYSKAERSLERAISEGNKALVENLIPASFITNMQDLYNAVLWRTNPVKAALNAVSNSSLGQEAR
jgi:serine/threonine protein kinase